MQNKTAIDLQAFYERRKRLEADWGEHALSHASDMSFADYAVMRLMQAEDNARGLVSAQAQRIEALEAAVNVARNYLYEQGNVIDALNALDMVESEAE